MSLKQLRVPFKQMNQLRCVNLNQEKVKKWNQTIQSKANSSEAKMYVGQLSSLIQFYNRKTLDQESKEIDWDQWEQQIETKGLVQKVKDNLEMLQNEEYDTERVCNQVVASQSKELDELNNDLHYHGVLWLTYILEQRLFLQELQEYGNFNDYSITENYDRFTGQETQLEVLNETHNYIPGSTDDINYMGYFTAQFAWGKKVVSFYRHPADDFKCLVATKNILGR